MGALTSKPYAFTARPWELRNVETIDIGDTECVPIRVQLKGNQILRVLPLINNHSKSDWISDRARFSYDGFYNQRLTTILYTNQFLRPRTTAFVSQAKSLNWVQALTFLGRYVRMTSTRMLFVVNHTLSVSEWLSLERKAASRGQSHLLFAQSSEINNFSSDLVPLFNLKEVDQKIKETNSVITIGLNLREQFPILYTNLRQRSLNDLTFTYYYLMSNNITSHSDTDFGINLGNSASVIWNILEGKHPLSKKLVSAESPLILVGGISQFNSYFFNFMATLYKLTTKISSLTQTKITIGFLSVDGNHLEIHYDAIGLNNCRQYWSNNVKEKTKSKLNINYNTFKTLAIRSNPLTICYNIGLPKSFTKYTFDSKFFDFIVYHSSHYQSETGFGTIDLALPDLAFFEKSGLYYNYTGIAQSVDVVVPLDTNTQVLKPIGLDYIWDTWFFKEDSLLNPVEERPIVSVNSIEVEFAEIFMSNIFLPNTYYHAQSALHYFFANTLNDYDCLLADDLSINSPTLNLMKNVRVQAQLNFIN